MKILKNWKCQECGYAQDFNPNDETKMNKIFRKKQVCPSCGKKINFIEIEIKEDEKLIKD